MQQTISSEKKVLFILSGWSVSESSRSTAWGSDASITDQFEVSECTLPGPSVGEITEDGVIASCHPPLA